MRVLLMLCYTLCVVVLTICGDDAETSSSLVDSDASEYLVPLLPSLENDSEELQKMFKDNKRRKKYRPEFEDDSNSKWVEGSPFKQGDMDCLIDLGKCSLKLADIKKTIMKALADGCKSCSVAEKKSAGSVVALMMFTQPEVWKQFLYKYDTNHNFMKHYS